MDKELQIYFEIKAFSVAWVWINIIVIRSSANDAGVIYWSWQDLFLSADAGTI